MADSNGTTSANSPDAAPEAVGGERPPRVQARAEGSAPARESGSAASADAGEGKAGAAAVDNVDSDDAYIVEAETIETVEAETVEATLVEAPDEADAAELKSDEARPATFEQAKPQATAADGSSASNSPPASDREVAPAARPSARREEAVRVGIRREEQPEPASRASGASVASGEREDDTPVVRAAWDVQGTPAGAAGGNDPSAPPPLDPTMSKTAPRKRPLLANTLQTGAAVQEALRARVHEATADTLPESQRPEPLTGSGAAGGRPQRDASGVQALGTPPAVSAVRAQPGHPSQAPAVPAPLGAGYSRGQFGTDARSRDAAALADTQQDPARHQKTQQQRAARSGRLSRTLRMEIKLGAGGPEVQPIAARSIPALNRAEPRDPYAQTEPDGKAVVIGPSTAPTLPTQRIGRAPDGADFVRERPGLHSTDPMGVPNARRPVSNAPPRFSVTARDGSGSGSFPGSVPPGLPRKRPSRPGERTIIMSRSYVVTKDWLFVALLVAALGVTASMLWSYRNQDAVLGPQNPDDTATVEQAITEEGNPDDLGGPIEPAYAGAPVRATELRTEPAGAEVVAAGAVVGNTPVRVARADADVEYTLRLSGYEPQRVRVGANSPSSIRVTLQPLAR